MKHTKGPWHESNTGNHQGLIISENTGENIAVSYDKANAALIAEAPSMFKFITDLVEYVKVCEELQEINPMQARSIIEEAQVIITKIERS